MSYAGASPNRRFCNGSSNGHVIIANPQRKHLFRDKDTVYLRNFKGIVHSNVKLAVVFYVVIFAPFLCISFRLMHHLENSLDGSQSNRLPITKNALNVSDNSPLVSIKQMTELSNEFQANDFIFPSRKFRIKYYMGDWFNITLRSADINCDGVSKPSHDKKRLRSDVDLFWSAEELESAVNAKVKDWRDNAYLAPALEVLTANKTSMARDSDRKMILFIGDSHTEHNDIPSVAKTRFSQYAVKNGGSIFKTIIWPLSMDRHYRHIDEYLELQKVNGTVAKWEDKKPTLIWRGGITGLKGAHHKLKNYPKEGWRITVVKKHFNTNRSIADIAFQSGHDTLKYLSSATKYAKTYVRKTHCSMEEQLRYKYLLMMEGNDVGTGLKWQLASNSVVFMAKPTTVSFMMEDILVPYVHYVPLKDDYSDIVEMVQWARENDEKCKWISEQATLFMEKLWISEKAKEEYDLIKQELGETYYRQFGDALQSCKPKAEATGHRTVSSPSISSSMPCGHGKRGNGTCPEGGACCSHHGWCGKSEAYCGKGHHQVSTDSSKGIDEAETTNVKTTEANEKSKGEKIPVTKPRDLVASEGCGHGKRGDGVCPNLGDCCSRAGWCGKSAEYCNGIARHHNHAQGHLTLHG